MMTSIIFSRLPFSTLTSFNAQSVCTRLLSCQTSTSIAMRSSTVYSPLTIRSTVSPRSLSSDSARNPTCPRFTPTSGIVVRRTISAARRIDPSPPSTTPSSISMSGTLSCTTCTGTGSAQFSVRVSRSERFMTGVSPARYSCVHAWRAASRASLRPVWANTRILRLSASAMYIPFRYFALRGVFPKSTRKNNDTNTNSRKFFR